ncbi:MAG: Mut7-C RNAse domain-containing protein [Syntrophales bacterium]
MFIADANLGKLVKWLRILGYDTTCYTGNADRDFLRKAQQEERIVLTKKRDMTRREFSGRLIVIQDDHVRRQIREVTDKLSLNPRPERLFSICLKCNEKLEKVSKEEIEGMIPAYIFESCSQFQQCRRCRCIFWSGTHRDNVYNFLKTHIQYHPL